MDGEGLVLAYIPTPPKSIDDMSTPVIFVNLNTSLPVSARVNPITASSLDARSSNR